MKTQTLLAALAVGFTVSTHALPSAQAEGDELPKATLKFTNNTAWTLDCRAVWGNVSLVFNSIAPSESSSSKSVPVSPTADRIAVCKKNGVAPSQSTTSAPIKFKTDKAGEYAITCTQATETSRPVCVASSS